MNLSIVLRLGQGNFDEDGFPVSLKVLADGKLIYEEDHRIPAAPEIPHYYKSFQERYEKLGDTRAIQPVPGQTTHGSHQEDLKACRSAIERLETEIEGWFKHRSFEMLRTQILLRTANVPSSQVIPIIIHADTTIGKQNTQLQKLPWHLWDLFTERPNAEPVLGAKIDTQVKSLIGGIKILAIFGSSEGGLALSHDELVLKQLEQLGAEIHLVNQPTRAELHNLLWNNFWDILFFAGHSGSNNQCTGGFIQLSDQQIIPIDGLREDLRRMVENGLKLAIFNSCAGLGIASELTKLKVPSMVVMREPVPDLVARTFLKYFLEDFSKGRSLYGAVQEARKRLQALENCTDHPCPAASWLPIICQNPNHPELVWSNADPPPTHPIFRKTILQVGGVGLLVLAALVGIPIPIKPPVSPRQNLTSTDSPHMSLGEKLLFANVVTADKQRGINAFAQKRYQDAINAFNASLEKNRNDPESVIYKNNAIANLPGTKRFRIGVSVPISSNPNVASEMLRGVAQAQNQVNTDGKGINGAKVEIKLADDDNDPELAQRVAMEFVNDNQILAVVGHNASNASGAAAPIYNQKNLVMITPTSYAETVTGYGKYIFQTTPTAQAFARALATYLVNTAHIRKAAVCYDQQAQDNETFREELKSSLQKLRSEIVKTTRCDLSSAQLNADDALDEASYQGAQALILSPFIDRMDRVLALVNANANHDPQFPLFGSPTFYTRQTLGAGSAINKLIFPAVWHPDSYPNTRFLQEATRLWKTSTVNWRTATSYDAAVAIFAALRQSQFRPGIQQALANPGFSVEGAEGASQKVSFDRDRTRNLPIYLVQVKSMNPSKSGTGFDFVLIK